MNDKNAQNEILREAAEYYGFRHQLLKLIEELGELSREAVKMLLGEGDKEHFSEECADVDILLDQIALYLPLLLPRMKEYRVQKIERLKQRIEQERGGEL